MSSFPILAHTHTLILLHGRGSSGPEFASELLESTTTTTNRTIAQELPSWKLVFPTALSRHSAVFQEDITEWFDIYSLTNPAVEASLQLEGLREGIAYVRALVNAELKDVPAERLVVSGISQRAAVAVHWRDGRRLRGFVGLSTWMPFASELRRPAGKGKEFSEFYGSTLRWRVTRELGKAGRMC
jgi:lysophospholipase-2